MDYSSPGSGIHGDSPGKNTGVGCMNNVQFQFQILLFRVKLLLQSLIKTEEEEIAKSCDKENI